MYYSNNTIVRSCFNHAIVNVNSCIGAKLAFLRTLGVDIFKHKLCDAIMVWYGNNLFYVTEIHNTLL